MAISYEEASNKVENEYNSIARQSRVRKYLQGLNLNKIMEKECCDVSAVLKKRRDISTMFTPRGPKYHIFEDAKTEFLYEIMIGIEWAKIP